MANLIDLLAYINFTNDDLKEIEDALENLEDTIYSKSTDDNFRMPSPLDFLKFGSITRKTKIKPLDDVDIIYVVGTAEKHLFGVGHYLKTCSINFPNDKREPSKNISSLLLLNDIKAAIKETYSRSVVSRNQEVVNVYLDSYKVGFDIVPAFYVESMDYYLIPEGSGGHQWKETRPKSGEDLFISANQMHNGQVRNAIKILKYWFQIKRIRTPKSYHLDCTLSNAFKAALYVQSDIVSALNFAFTNINYNNYLSSCPDPSGLGAPLSSGLSSSDIQNIVDKANEAKEKLKSSISDFVNYIDEDI